MWSRALGVLVSCSTLCGGWAGWAAADAPQENNRANVAPPYATAHAAPLEAKEALVREAAEHTLFRVEFNGIKKDRVPAYCYVPRRTPGAAPAPLPAILLQYGTGGNKKTDYIVAIGKQFVGRGLV